nr:unnamed protein product [Callosobruchus analis]
MNTQTAKLSPYQNLLGFYLKFSKPLEASTGDDRVALLGLVVALGKKKSKKKRTVCCKDWLKKRSVLSHMNLLNNLKLAPKDGHNYLRMDEDTYLQLLERRDTGQIDSLTHSYLFERSRKTDQKKTRKKRGRNGFVYKM